MHAANMKIRTRKIFSPNTLVLSRQYYSSNASYSLSCICHWRLQSYQLTSPLITTPLFLFGASVSFQTQYFMCKLPAPYRLSAPVCDAECLTTVC